MLYNKILSEFIAVWLMASLVIIMASSDFPLSNTLLSLRHSYIPIFGLSDQT